MPTYQLLAPDGSGFSEPLGTFSTREACYQAAIREGPGTYYVVASPDPDGPDEHDRDLEVSDEGWLTYRIPGSSNWHPWTP